MDFGAVLPHAEIAADPGALTEWAKGVEQLGFTHIRIPDHILGVNTASRPNWTGLYALDTPFLEPLTTIAFMAAVTERVCFLSSILILPQRQTVLVAKQAANIDLLSKGRLWLGVGSGWNKVEYQALGVDFAARGEIMEEQIGVLRELWTKDAVTIDLPYHKIDDAGLCPAPLQRPIPIWMGGGIDPSQAKPASEKVLRRIARLADGWMPVCAPNDQAAEIIERYRGYCREYGRDPGSIGLAGGLQASLQSEAKWIAVIEGWKKLGATHAGISTMHDGLSGADQHLRRLERVANALGGLLHKPEALVPPLP